MSRQRFANQPSSIGNARRFVSRELADADSNLIDDVSLMVSELATNCVRHSSTSFTVEVERTSGAIRVEVTDGGEGVPAVRPRSLVQVSGRGLQIVEGLASSWGVVPAPEGEGKTVWFTLRT